MVRRRFKQGPLQAEVNTFALEATDESSWGRRVYSVKGGLVFRSWGPGVFERITVPDGFRTDLASIPVWAVPFIGLPDRYLVPAVLHDWLCTHNYPRWYTNALLRSSMELTGTSAWRCKAVFWAVYLFGYASPISGFFSRRNVRRVQNGS